MPADVTARHRAGGVGRVLALRTAAPRHAAPGVPGDEATVEFRALRPRRWPWALAVPAVLMLVALLPLTREPGTPRFAVPLPKVSVPRLPAMTGPPAATTTRRQVQAVRQAAKPSPTSSSADAARVLLGPGTDADLPALLGSYCRATRGRLTLAVATGEDWVCARVGRAATALDMDAMCRWRYGDSAWADLGRAGDPRSWRCYRDGP